MYTDTIHLNKIVLIRLEQNFVFARKVNNFRDARAETDQAKCRNIITNQTKTIKIIEDKKDAVQNEN